MLNWNEKTTSEIIILELQKELTVSPAFGFLDEPEVLEVNIGKVPEFLKNHVALSIFKKQCLNYPKQIKFTTSNLTSLKFFKENKIVITYHSVDNKKPSPSSTNLNKGDIKNKMISIPEVARVRDYDKYDKYDSKGNVESENDEDTLENSLIGVLENRSTDLPDFKQAFTIETKDKIEQTLEPVLEENIESVVQLKPIETNIKTLIELQIDNQEDFKDEIKVDEVGMVVYNSEPKLKIFVAENRKPAIVVIKITKIAIPKQSSEKVLSTDFYTDYDNEDKYQKYVNNFNVYNDVDVLDKENQAKEGDFADLTSRLFEATEKIEKSNSFSLEDRLKMKSSLEKDFENRKYEDNFTVWDKIKSIFEFKFIFPNFSPKFFIVGLGTVIFGVIIGTTFLLTNLPTYAYSIELNNELSEKNEVVKISKTLMENKDLDLNVYLEKSVPKEKKQDLPLAKGQVLLYSKGANSCNITNGNFFIGFEDKTYKVLPNDNYYGLVNIPAYSSENSNLVFNIEAVGSGAQFNLEKGQVLNLVTQDGENLSKNCFAKTVDTVNNFIYIGNDQVNNDIVSELKTSIEKANKKKEDEEMEKLKNQGLNVENTFTISSEFKDAVNTKVGESSDIIAISRKQNKTVSYVSNEKLAQIISKGLPQYKAPKDIKVANSVCNKDTQSCDYTLKYNIVSREIDSVRVISILENNTDEKQAVAEVKKEFPQVKSIVAKSEGINIPKMKKVKLI
jgi:hypothetical protein